MKVLLKSAACAAALVTSASATAQLNPLSADAAAFGAREAVNEMSLSPDGKHAVYVGPARDRWSAVMVIDLVSGEAKPVLVAKGDPEVLHWCNFASSDRIVCRFSGTDDEGGILIGYARLVSLNLDGSDVKELGQRQSFYDTRLRQYDGSILDWQSSRPGSVLMERSYVPESRTGSRMVARQRGLGVDLIDARTLKTEQVEAPRDFVQGYITDGRGNVRVMTMFETDGQMVTDKVRHFYRAAGIKEWTPLTALIDEDDYRPLAIDAATDSLYALKKLNGRMALYSIKLDSSLREQLIASNPLVDIDGVVRLGDGLSVIGYTYAEARRQVHYFNKEFEALANALSKALPNTDSMSFADASADGKKLLIFTGGAKDPGRYYLYDKQSRELNELLEDRPQLGRRALGNVTATTYQAPDGTRVPAYVTLPAGKPPKNLPAVVLPHGGPSARDEWGFDWLAQFLAARGYAVIQPNFRGSAGFGDAWLMDNGFKSWRTSIGDINAAARFLIDSGTADPNRMAVLGWSYGGYAALQSAITEPALYKAVVAIAPVTDLTLLKKEAEDYTNYDLVAKFVGSGPHLVEGSPLRRASALKVPVLLVHGDKDLNVDIEQSDKMYDALKDAGVTVDYIRIQGLDHQLRDSAERTTMLTRIGALLGKTIGN